MPNPIPQSWQETNISSVANIDLGGTPSRNIADYWNGDIKWLAIQDIVNSDGRYVNNSSETITKKGLDNSAAKILPKNTVVISARGTVGKIALLAEPMTFNQSCYGLTAKNKSELDQHYLYYAVKNIVKKSKRLGHGGVFNTFTKETFDHIQISLPKTILEQEKIASILSAFDDKIEVNNKIAKTLEQMALNIFKEWFVKFRFPGHEKVKFVDSDMGKIPQKWKVSNLGKLSDNFDRKRKPLSNMEREKIKGKYPYYGATEIMDYINKYIFDGEYLLIAEDGSVETNGGKPVIQFIKGKFWVNNHAHIIQGKGNIKTTYLYLVLKNTYIKPFITGAVQLKLTQENLNKIQAIEPTDIMLNLFYKVTDPLFAKKRVIEFENQKLAAMRDLLLPKLMRGEIKV